MLTNSRFISLQGIASSYKRFDLYNFFCQQFRQGHSSRPLLVTKGSWLKNVMGQINVENQDSNLGLRLDHVTCFTARFGCHYKALDEPAATAYRNVTNCRKLAYCISQLISSRKRQDRFLSLNLEVKVSQIFS